MRLASSRLLKEELLFSDDLERFQNTFAVTHFQIIGAGGVMADLEGSEVVGDRRVYMLHVGG